MSTAPASGLKAVSPDDAPASDWRLVSAAAALALVARLIAMLVLRSWHFERWDGVAPTVPFAFGAETGSIASSLATGHGFGSPFHDVITGPTAWIAPIYPSLIAVIFKICGPFTAAAGIASLTLNSVFSSLTCFPIYEAGRRTVGRRVALWSVFLWALCPVFWRWPITWVWEMSLSALLFTCAFWFALLLREGAGGRGWAAFGAFWGVCALANPSILVFAPISALWAAWPQLRTPRGWMRTAILAGVTCVLVMSPWLLRNRLVLGRWVFVRDNFPFELSLGNYHLSNAMGWAGRHPDLNPAMMREYEQLGELAFVDKYGGIARRFIRENPGEFLRLSAHRFAAFWDGEPIIYNPVALEWWQPWMFWSLSLLALLGGVFAVGGKAHAARMYVLAILLYPLPYYVTYPQLRYRHAVEPLMLLLSVYLFEQLWQGFRRSRGSQSSAAGRTMGKASRPCPRIEAHSEAVSSDVPEPQRSRP